jgi:hypothetical protein
MLKAPSNNIAQRAVMRTDPYERYVTMNSVNLLERNETLSESGGREVEKSPFIKGGAPSVSRIKSRQVIQKVYIIIYDTLLICIIDKEVL